MRKIILLLLLVSSCVYSAEVSDVVNDLVEKLAEDYTQALSHQFYSKQPVSIIEVRNASKEMEENYVGQSIEELLKNAIADSLIFKLIDRKNLEVAMEEVKLSLSGLTDEKDAPELGKIRGVKLLIDGSVSEEGNTVIVSLRLTDVETTEVVAVETAAIPKSALIAESNKIAYEYVTANGIGLSIFATPLRYIVLNQSPPVKEGDNKMHTATVGGQLTYRLDRNWKFSLNTDINSKGVFFDLRKIGKMENLTAYGTDPGDVFGPNGPTIERVWEKDGSIIIPDSNDVKAYLDDKHNYYTLSQQTTNVSFLISRVFNINRKFNFSVGAGPHINWLRYNQIYDNVPILINEGIAFKRYEITMDFLGLGGSANANIEYFILPRFAVSAGISGFYSWILPRGKDLDARSPTTGEYYYSKENHSIESFGLDPFMMPDGRYITEDLFPTNYVKGYMGFSIYF